MPKPMEMEIMLLSTFLMAKADSRYGIMVKYWMVLWFSVENVDVEYEKLLKMNVTIIEKPTNNPWGSRHMMFCDPDGNRVRFITPTK